MSMQDYEKTKEVIKESRGIPTFVGPRSVALVNIAEERLAVKFPEICRRFLLEFGAGGVGSFEIYGIVGEDFENSSIPDVVWFTLRERQETNLPSFLLPVFDLGDRELFCLDLRVRQGHEAKVVGFTSGYTSAQQSLDTVAEDFGRLFLDLIQSELDIKRS